MLSRVREIRGGKLNESQFGSRMRGQGDYASQLRQVFKLAIRRHGLDQPIPEMWMGGFAVPEPSMRESIQFELF